MADRKSLFSRFWPASAARRTPTTQTIEPPPTIPASPPPPTPNRHPTTTTQPATPPSAPPPTSSRRPTPTTQPATDHQTTGKKSTSTISEPRKSPSTQTQTSITSTNPTDEPKTKSPSRGTTQSSSPSKPASPNRRVAKSRSPPQPSSPSRLTQHTGSQTPKSASNSRLNSPSPKAGSSSSPKRTLPKSPSKESRQPAQDILSKEKEPKPTTSQQEPQLNAEVETDSPNNFNGKNLDGKSFKQDKVGPTPSQSSEIGTINSDHEPPVELTAKPNEVEDVKEVLQATTTEANEETKNEKTGSEDQIIEKTAIPNKPLSSGSEDQIIEKTTIPNKPLSSSSDDQIIEKMTIASKPLSSGSNDQIIKKTEIPSKPLSSSSEDQIIEKTTIHSKPDQVQREEKEPLHTKETLGVTPGNPINSQPKIIRSTISNTHNKPALPNGEHAPLQQNINDNKSTFANQMAIGDPLGVISDKHVSVITLAGENRGASMQMESNSSKRDVAVHIYRSYKTNPDESAEATTDGEGSSDRKKSEEANSTDDLTTETHVNNNSQGINNSIVLNSSITEGNPGVHMVFTLLPKEQIQSTNKANFPETRKAEFNTTRTEKHTYQPTVRRRCLKGLFLEPSDSDPEDPEKPRRHGCRVGCEKTDTENNTDVL